MYTYIYIVVNLSFHPLSDGTFYFLVYQCGDYVCYLFHWDDQATRQYNVPSSLLSYFQLYLSLSLISLSLSLSPNSTNNYIYTTSINYNYNCNCNYITTKHKSFVRMVPSVVCYSCWYYLNLQHSKQTIIPVEEEY